MTGNELYSADTDGGPTRAAIRIYAGVAAEVACNMVDASNNQGIYFHFLAAATSPMCSTMRSLRRWPWSTITPVA